MTLEVGEFLGEVGPMGNPDLLARVLDLEEGDDLVERPFHEELNLAVLIGGPDCA